jgi:3-oxoacyl-[acyl-carrier protein] reductase
MDFSVADGTRLETSYQQVPAVRRGFGKMDMGLRGKRALVTGAAGGIGGEICRMLAGEGCAVIVHDLAGRAEASERLVAELGRSGVEATTFAADLSKSEEVRALAKSAEEWRGGLDIVVNNAATLWGPPQEPWLSVDEERWLGAYQTNALAPASLARHLIPGMVARGFGRIICISSMSGVRPYPTEPHYAASKAALINLAMGISKAFAGTGVSAVTISPGPILTPLFESSLRELARKNGWNGTWEEIQKRAAAEAYRLTAGRIGQPKDIARAVVFLASPASDFITGINLHVCGGSSSETH